MGMPGPLELAFIALIILLFFGAQRIPEIARGVGKGIREFKDATGDIKREIENEGRERPRAQAPRHGTPQAREKARYGDAEHEPEHQEAGRPADSQSGPPEPASAANPGEDKEDRW